MPRALAALLLLAACPRALAAEVVARMGHIEVTVDDLRAYVETLGEEERAAVTRDPALLGQVVRTYLARQAVVREATERKWDQSKAVKAKLERVREQALSELYLDSVARPPEGFPSEAELQVAYDANRASFAVPRQYRVAQIFIASGPGKGADEGRRRADDVARKARAKDADFAALARAESDEKGAAQRGGEIGWLTEEKMVPGIRATVAALAKDQVSDPVRLDDGWHVLKLLDAKPPSTRTLPEVRDALSARLRAERAQAVRREYLARLLESTPPAVNELALGRALSPR
jgi:peptidylprolyl isomerase